MQSRRVAREQRLDVFAFLDYRAYLRSFYTLGRKHRLSYRAFARRAELRSPNYLKLVIDGQRNLSREMAPRFATACGLSGEAARYFNELVALEHATTLETRNAHYQRLLGFRRCRKLQKLEVAQEAYHSHWYLPAIRELVARPDFREDPAWIAGLLDPPVRPAEVKHALDVLLELGLLKRDPTGKLVQSTASVTTGAETASLHVANYHAAMMAHATRALDRVAAEDRDISALTLLVSAAGMQRIKQAVQRFRRELLLLAEEDAEPKRVVQLNFQLFPLTRPETGTGEP
jgi:uncharacterized protein (TIGR02147 family)